MEEVEPGPRAENSVELLNSIAEQFRLGVIVRAKDIGGAYNLNLRLQTSTGEYVIRVHRPWVKHDRLSMIHAVKSKLRASSFPVPEPMISATGETIVFYNNRLVEVERFVQHDGVADNWQRYSVAFSMLGKLHSFLAEGLPGIPLVRPQVSNYETPELLLNWTQQVESKIRQSKRDGEALHALEICQETKRLLMSMQEYWQSIGNWLPKQLIHGDYGGGNLLFNHNQVAAILDFDFLAVRERIYELAYSLYWMLVPLEHKEKSPTLFSWFRLREMLESYNSNTSRPITSEEIQAMPMEMARVPLYWIAEANFLPNPIETVIRLEDSVKLSGWILQHSDEIVELLYGKLHEISNAS